AGVTRLAFPDYCRLVAARAFQMTVKAIVGSVERTAQEPFRERKFPLQNFFEWLEPIEVAGALRPEALGIVGGPFAQRFVLGEAFDPRLGRELGGRLELAYLGKDRIDLTAGIGCHVHTLPRASRVLRLKYRVAASPTS